MSGLCPGCAVSGLVCGGASARLALLPADVAGVGNAVRYPEPAHLLAGLSEGVGDVFDVLACAEQFPEGSVYFGADLVALGDEFAQALDPFTFAHALNNATRVGQTLLLCLSCWPYTLAMDATQAPAAESATCRRCGRKLTKSTGIGPRCAAIEAATEGLNAKQVDKMTQVIEDRGIVATNRKGVYKIVNEAGVVIHTTHVNGNCTCEWGVRRTSADTKVCYMVAAARLLARPVIRKAAPASAPVALPSSEALWAEIDRMNAAFMAMA